MAHLLRMISPEGNLRSFKGSRKEKSKNSTWTASGKRVSQMVNLFGRGAPICIQTVERPPPPTNRGRTLRLSAFRDRGGGEKGAKNTEVKTSMQENFWRKLGSQEVPQ